MAFGAALAQAGATPEEAHLGALALAQELYARLLRWVVDHINLCLRQAARPAPSHGMSRRSSQESLAGLKISRQSSSELFEHAEKAAARTHGAPIAASTASAGRSRRSSRESLAGSETSRQRSIAAPVAGGRVGGEAVVLEPGGFEGGSDGANGLDQLVHNYLLEGLVGQMHAAPAPADPLKHRRAPKSPGKPGTPPRSGPVAGASLLSFATAPAPRSKRPTPIEASPASPVAAAAHDHNAWGSAEHATRLLQQLAPLADIEPHAVAAALERCSKELQACFATLLSDDDDDDDESPNQRKRRPSGALSRSPSASPARGGGARWGEVAAAHAGRAQQVRYAAGAQAPLLQAAARAWPRSNAARRTFELLCGSTSRFVAALCEPTAEALRQARIRPKHATPWLAAEGALEARVGTAVALLRRLHAPGGAPCFVCCVAPGHGVAAQLEVLGLAARADELRCGHPFAAPLPRWFARYGGLAYASHHRTDDASLLHLAAPRLLEAMEVAEKDASIGSTSLALSARGLLQAEHALARSSARALAMQQATRGKLARKEVAARKESIAMERGAVAVQQQVRGRLARRSVVARKESIATRAREELVAEAHARKRAATAMQRHFKGFQHRDAAEKRRSALLFVQRSWREAHRRQVIAQRRQAQEAKKAQARRRDQDDAAAVKMQTGWRGRSARKVVGELRRDERAEAAVEVLVWHVRGWLPRRRFSALRCAARVLQPALREMLLRWEVLGVRELRRGFHRRFVAHRQRLGVLEAQLAQPDLPAKKQQGLAQLVMRTRYQLRQLQVLMVERHKAAINAARRTPSGSTSMAASPRANAVKTTTASPPNRSPMDANVAVHSRAAKAAAACVPEAAMAAEAAEETARAAEAEAAQADEEMAEATGLAEAAAARGSPQRVEQEAEARGQEAVARATAAHRVARVRRDAAASAAERLEQVRAEAATAADDFEIAELEAAVASEAAAAAERTDKERQAATREVLAALPSEEAVDRLPTATLALAMEQLEAELALPLTTEIKRYALRRQVKAIGVHHKRRLADAETLRRAKDEAAAHRAAFVRKRPRTAPGTPGAATKVAGAAVEGEAGAMSSRAFKTPVAFSHWSVPRRAAAAAAAAAASNGGAGPSQSPVDDDLPVGWRSSTRPPADVLAAWAAQSCRQFIRTGLWRTTPSALASWQGRKFMSRELGGEGHELRGVGLMAPAHVVVDASSLSKTTPEKVFTASRLLYAPLPAGCEAPTVRSPAQGAAVGGERGAVLVQHESTASQAASAERLSATPAHRATPLSHRQRAAAAEGARLAHALDAAALPSPALAGRADPPWRRKPPVALGLGPKPRTPSGIPRPAFSR